MLNFVRTRPLTTPWLVFAANALAAVGCAHEVRGPNEMRDAASTVEPDSSTNADIDAVAPLLDAGSQHTPDAHGRQEAGPEWGDSALSQDSGLVDAADSGSTPDAMVVTRTCTSPAVPYAPGMVAEGEHGYVITLSKSEPAPPQVGYNTWLVTLTDASKARALVTDLTLHPFMPTHGHGAKFAPTIVALGEGQYEINVHFSMPGYWRMTFEFDVEAELQPDLNSFVFAPDAGSLVSAPDAGLLVDAAAIDAGSVVDATTSAAPGETETTLRETIVLHLCI